MNYSRPIKILRSTKGLEQKEFADRLGVNQSFISLIESGKRKPSLDFIEKVSETFSIPIQVLMLLAKEQKDIKKIRQEDITQVGEALLSMVVD